MSPELNGATPLKTRAKTKPKQALVLKTQAPLPTLEDAIEEPIREPWNPIREWVFMNQTVRTYLYEDDQKNPWFFATDVCKALGLNLDSGVTTHLKKLRDTEKRNTPNQIWGIRGPGNPNVVIINEPGLYRLIFRSDKAEAEQFQDWVFNDVLPSIREHGYYALDSKRAAILECKRAKRPKDIGWGVERAPIRAMTQRNHEDLERIIGKGFSFYHRILFWRKPWRSVFKKDAAAILRDAGIPPGTPLVNCFEETPAAHLRAAILNYRQWLLKRERDGKPPTKDEMISKHDEAIVMSFETNRKILEELNGVPMELQLFGDASNGKLIAYAQIKSIEGSGSEQKALPSPMPN